MNAIPPHMACLLIGGLSFLLPFKSRAEQSRFSTAGFYPLDGTGRQAYSMNPAWRFIKGDAVGPDSPSFEDSKWNLVNLSNGLEYLPVECSGGINYQGPAWFRKHFTPDESLKGRELFLDFEAFKEVDRQQNALGNGINDGQ